MIGYLRGKTVILTDDVAIIETMGIGFRVFIPVSTRNRIHLNEEVALHIHTSVREDAIILYGFFSEEEYTAFMNLISVSGIGPKGALAVLSAITADKLYKAIQNKEINILTKLPGIGKKSAERMILELKDKVAFNLGDENIIENEEEILSGDAKGEAKAALSQLGYSNFEIAEVLKKIKNGNCVEDIIKEALKGLSLKI